MSEFLSPDQILTFGKQATSLLERHEVLPAPENYKLWYWYATQRNDALNAALDLAVKEGLASNLDHARVLHARFFGESANESFEEIGIQLSAELQKLTGSMQRAGEDTAAFDKTLTRAGLELDGGVPDIKSIVQKLAAATRAVQSRNKTLEDQLQGSLREVDGLRTRMESVRKESLTDALTGLANRRSFDEAARRAVDAAITDGKPMSLIISDVDHFKKFNDTYGHSIGDQVLRLVGQCLRTNVKGKDLAARFGGEEFVVILPETKLEHAAAVASDIRKSVESKKIVQKSTGRDMGTVTLSLGVAQYVPGEQIADLLNRADACLYAAKRSGRNRVLTERELTGGIEVQQTGNENQLDKDRSQDSISFEYAVRAICRDGAVPLRSNIDLRQFHRFARWMVIAEPDPEQKKIPMRLVGSGFHDLLGKDVTGMDYLEFTDRSVRSAAFETLMALVTTPCALWQMAPMVLPNGRKATIEYTTFPLYHDREQKHQFICLARHQFADSVKCDGTPSIQKASMLKWLDLGKGVPNFDGKAKSAA
ncbi:MAG: diguanylate cyclase [Micropepsaceae bacterium]